jgi:polar amino acid transport system substrate-binding protein
MRTRIRGLLLMLVVLALVAAACAQETPAPGDGDGNGAEPTTPAETPADQGLLARILEDGEIRVATDPAYPPQSFLNDETGEFEGFDIDVATEIANRLGVDIGWETPSWNALTSGGWADRWDMSVGSMTVTEERDEVLHFTTAYYFTPASVAVHEDNTTVQDLETDLDGSTIGACGACTYDLWLQGELEIPGYTFDYIIDNPTIRTYDTDTTVIQDLSLGDGVRLDAMVSAQPTIQEAIDAGTPIKIVGDPVFFEPLAVAFDRAADPDPQPLVDRVSQIIEEMHADGTLTELSMKWYDEDLTRTE